MRSSSQRIGSSPVAVNARCTSWRMEKLMAALVSRDRCEGEVVGVGVALERLGRDGQQILIRRAAPAVLRAARRAVNRAVLDTSNKPRCSRGARDMAAAGTPFGRSQRPR
jgi:hypothetical protein